ncbi:hypothetical protein PG991_011586 [Apiospora marii]|uniref:Uncharacterized protein n=1 Tax=Apiospora marii TaxID=335849 RepID=A0ABR1REX4_9PEZI
MHGRRTSAPLSVPLWPSSPLAPTTSESYPASQQAMPERVPGSRRTSSIGSEKSLRYLKLGPVHWGEHQDENKEDFHHVE